MIIWTNVAIAAVLVAIGGILIGPKCKTIIGSFLGGVIQGIIILIIFPLIGLPLVQ